MDLPGTTELTINPDMELNSDWAAYNAPTSQAQSTTEKHAGSNSWKFDTSGANTGIQSAAVFITAAATTHTFRAWVYPDDDTIVRVEILDGDGSDGFDQTFTGLTQDAWNLITATYTDTPGGGLAKIKFSSGTATTGVWYIDDVSYKANGSQMPTDLDTKNQTDHRNWSVVGFNGKVYATNSYDDPIEGDVTTKFKYVGDPAGALGFRYAENPEKHFTKIRFLSLIHI